MNAEQCEALRQTRVRVAEAVKTELHKYKACLVCLSISIRAAAVCPVCKAYQWDESPEAVTASVDAAALTVFPFTLGYAPGYPREYKIPCLS